MEEKRVKEVIVRFRNDGKKFTVQLASFFHSFYLTLSNPKKWSFFKSGVAVA